MKRPGSPSDPTPQRILGFDGRNMLYSILDTFSEIEAGVIALRFGLTDGRQRSLDEVARIYGISRYKAKSIEQQALGRIRFDRKILDILGVDYDMWKGKVRGEFVSLPSYSSSMAAGVEVAWCSQCGKVPLIGKDEISKGGRPRKYCSAQCRQAAYRARKTRGTATNSPKELCSTERH